MNEIKDLKELPAELDQKTALFAYGSLLEHEQLRELLRQRGEFRILETENLARAVRLVIDNPRDIVILRNVRLENVRVCIVTETILRRWFENRGGSIEEHIESGVAPIEIPRSLFLYARPSDPFEKGKSLNGGLIFNFQPNELSVLDKYEFAPVLKRTRAPELKIAERAYFPRNITFYAGTESFDDIQPEEKAERARLLNLNRKRGRLSPQARWPERIRQK